MPVFTKLLSRILLPVLMILLFSTITRAQDEPRWRYTQEISFPLPDSIVNPYLSAIDSHGRLYVVSSRVTNANAHNIIFYADSTDSVFTEMVDFTAKFDTLNVWQIIGVTAIDNDLVVTSRMHSSVNPSGVSNCYYFPDGDTAQVQKYGFGVSAGWGTFVYAVSATKDSILFAGLPYGGTSIRAYNFTKSVTTPGYASWFTMSGTPQEPGGPNSSGFDVIRDIAADPNADYNNPESVWYSSRNALSATSGNGGIARWAGGTQLTPEGYVGTRVTDANGDLAFGSSIPYGITVDNMSRLWVAGIDTNRRWVKAFEVDNFNFASEAVELPSKFSKSNPDTAGAPLTLPCDVALTKDGLTAYVIDGGQKAAFKFKFKKDDVVISVDENNYLGEFTLNQNYPNPFNPTTNISYTLPEGMNVKLMVANLLGQEITTLFEGYQPAGNHMKLFNASNLSSGMYFYILKGDNLLISKKMTLLK